MLELLGQVRLGQVRLGQVRLGQDIDLSIYWDACMQMNECNWCLISSWGMECNPCLHANFERRRRRSALIFCYCATERAGIDVGAEFGPIPARSLAGTECRNAIKSNQEMRARNERAVDTRDAGVAAQTLLFHSKQNNRNCAKRPVRYRFCF